MLLDRMRAGKWNRLGLTLVVIALTAFPPARAAASYDYRIARDLRYTPPGWPVPLSGDLYLPKRAGPLPVVLVVHGGSWKSGTRSSFDAVRIARHLATRGYAAFSVDYRLAPEVRFPVPLADLQEAVAWLRANAASYELDPNAVGAWGYSAGAHLVAMLGTQSNAALQLRAVVAGGIPADLTRWPDSPAVKVFLGKSGREDLELSAGASPLRHIGAHTAPFFLYHGASDRLVEPEQTKDFAAALTAHNIAVEVHYLPHFGHLLTAAFPGKVLDKGVTFLAAHMGAPAATASAAAANPALLPDAL